MKNKQNRKKLVTKKFIVLTVLSTMLLGIVLGISFGNRLLEFEASDIWLEFIEDATFTRESLDVESEGYKLEVELFIPEGGLSKKPVVVFAGGSGPGIYQDYSGTFVTETIIEYYHSHDIDYTKAI